MGELWTFCNYYTVVLNPLNHALNHVLNHLWEKSYINSEINSNQRSYYVVAGSFKAIFIGTR